MKQGDLLKRAVLVSDLSATAVAEKLNISRGQLYNLYNLDVLPEHWVEKFQKIGIVLDNPSKMDSSGADIELRILKMQVENYENQISFMQKLIDAHEKEGPLLSRMEALLSKSKKQ